MHPAPGYVVLEILENEQPESLSIAGTEDIPQRGKVLRVGPSTYYDTGEVFECPAEVGDVVVHSGHGFENFRVEGEQFRICPFNKILLVLEREDEETQ